jgi:hypothetical protein
MIRKVFFFLAVLLIGMLACVVPSGVVPTPVVVTQVVVVPNEQVQPSPSLLPPTVPPPALTFTIAPTDTPASIMTITPTATTSGPVVTLIKDANCRNGPGTTYDVVTSYFEGETLSIVGRNPDFDNTWWYVEMPTGGECWMSFVAGQAYGPFDDIPIVTP